MELLDSFLLVSMGMTGLALALVFVRLIVGPSLPDRVVSLDMISFLAIGLTALLALFLREPVYLDAAIVLALISFLATVAFSRYIETRTASGEGEST